MMGIISPSSLDSKLVNRSISWAILEAASCLAPSCPSILFYFSSIYHWYYHIHLYIELFALLSISAPRIQNPWAYNVNKTTKSMKTWILTWRHKIHASSSSYGLQAFNIVHSDMYCAQQFHIDLIGFNNIWIFIIFKYYKLYLAIPSWSENIYQHSTTVYTKPVVQALLFHPNKSILLSLKQKYSGCWTQTQLPLHKLNWESQKTKKRDIARVTHCRAHSEEPWLKRSQQTGWKGAIRNKEIKPVLYPQKSRTNWAMKKKKWSISLCCQSLHLTGEIARVWCPRFSMKWRPWIREPICWLWGFSVPINVKQIFICHIIYIYAIYHIYISTPCFFSG